MIILLQRKLKSNKFTIDKFYVSQKYFINFINCKNVRFVEVMKC